MSIEQRRLPVIHRALAIAGHTRAPVPVCIVGWRIPCDTITPGGKVTHPLGRFSEPGFSTAGSIGRTESDERRVCARPFSTKSVQRQNIFVVCATPHRWLETGSVFFPRGCVILSPSVVRYRRYAWRGGYRCMRFVRVFYKRHTKKGKKYKNKKWRTLKNDTSCSQS